MTPNRIKTIFLDRDGILVAGVGNNKYVKGIDQLTFIEENIKIFRAWASRYGVHYVIVTNQAGVEKKIITAEEVDLVNNFIVNEMLKQGVSIIATYVCPHRPESNCLCRKPKPGMLISAIRRFNLNPSECLLIGDRETDVLAGNRAEIRSFLISEDMKLNERMEVLNEITTILDEN